MPRQANFRQRGAKKKKEKVEEWKPSKPSTSAAAATQEAEASHYIDTQPAGAAPTGDAAAADPAWMRGAAAVDDELAADATAPFGYVDQDLKAYLRSAITSLTALAAAAKEGGEAEEDEEVAHDGQSASERTVLRDAVLKEINGHELAVATDPDTSRALELLLGCMEPRQIRVVADRLSGSLQTLAKHRFGSHSLQSTMRSLQLLLHANASLKGKKKAAQEAVDQGDAGVLRDAATLLLDYTDELLPVLADLTQDPFGTHIVRSLLQLLAGRSLEDTALRSKKSTLYRSRDTAAASLEASNGLATGAGTLSAPPASFGARLVEVRKAIMGSLGANEVRAMSVSTTGSPTLQLLLEHEGMPLPSGPLDLVLDGLITAAAAAPTEAAYERSAHVEALLRDVVGSHLLQKALALLPRAPLALFWQTYIAKRMCNLGAHPNANFVVASCARRLPCALEAGVEVDLLGEALDELEAAGEKLVKEAKLGVVSALVERSGAVAVAHPPPPPPKRGARPQTLEQRALKAVLRSFGIDAEREEERKCAVQVVLCMKTRKRWEKERNRLAEKARAKAGKVDEDEEMQESEEKPAEAEVEAEATVADAEPAPAAAPLALGWTEEQDLGEWEATMQGSVLLQTLFRLGSPANDVLYESLLALPSLLPLARSQVASHVLVAALSTPTATFQQRKQLIASLTLILHELIDAAPRVAHSVWERSDGFTKERLMFALQRQERFLQGSARGRGFVKNVNMALFRKSVGEWKKWLAGQPKAQPLLPRLGQEAVEETHKVEEKTAESVVVQPAAEDAAVGATAAEDEQPKSKKRGREGKSERDKKKKLRQTDIELEAILADVK